MASCAIRLEFYSSMSPLVVQILCRSPVRKFWVTRLVFIRKVDLQHRIWVMCTQDSSLLGSYAMSTALLYSEGKLQRFQTFVTVYHSTQHNIPEDFESSATSLWEPHHHVSLALVSCWVIPVPVLRLSASCPDEVFRVFVTSGVHCGSNSSKCIMVGSCCDVSIHITPPFDAV
jgi:hypothetical protein